MSEPKYEYVGSRLHQTLVGRPSDSAWDQAMTHRKMILQLLPTGESPGRRGTLCVLGAGDCCDLNLKVLLERHHEVHLVDLDQARLDQAVVFQDLISNPRIRRHGDIDITGVGQLLDLYARQPEEEIIGQIESAAREFSLGRLGNFDFVLSANVLPDLIQRSVDCLGAANSRLAEVAELLVQRHVETMLDLTTPGGHAILVTEIATSESLPELKTAPMELGDLVRLAHDRGGIHPGCHPVGIDNLLRTHRAIASRLQQYDASPLWTRQSGREYGLYMAYRMVRRKAEI